MSSFASPIAAFLAGYRPAQWISGHFGTLTLSAPTVENGTLSPKPTIYVFDAVISVDHEQTVELTDNPVQTGASITDHAYLLPTRVVADIEMSDAMQSFTTGQFTGDPSRSVSAYQTLSALQQNFAVMTIQTRIATYDNMMIVGLAPNETVETAFALKVRVTFRQIIPASIQDVAAGGNADNSARPQTTDDSVTGTTQTSTPGIALADQHEIVPDSSGLVSRASLVPGAGSWSSSNVLGIDN